MSAQWSSVTALRPPRPPQRTHRARRRRAPARSTLGNQLCTHDPRRAALPDRRRSGDNPRRLARTPCCVWQTSAPLPADNGGLALSGQGAKPRSTVTEVSVCIAAHNEEATISHTIRSFLSQQGVHIAEILVCVNGCTDGTEATVESLAQEHPIVRAIVLPQAGKPTAWNTLLVIAQAPVIVFADADVVVEPNAVCRLIQALDTDRRLIAATGRFLPVASGLGPLRRLLARPTFTAGCLTGRLYAVRPGELMVRMQELGQLEMPEQVIGDDLWVTLMVGPRRWVEVTDALVYYVPPAPSELLETYRRAYRGDQQLRDLIPDQHRRNHERTGSRIGRLAGWLLRGGDLALKARAVLSLVLLWEVRGIARLETAWEDQARHGHRGGG